MTPWQRPTTLLLSAVFVLSACSSTPPVEDQVPTEGGAVSEYEADPILIRVTRDGEEFVGEHIEASEVFQHAYYDFQARRYDDAAANYQVIIDHFPDSRFYLAALYNGGLAYEEIDQWEQAARAYRTIVEEFADADEALNARFRLAGALHELGRYDEVDELLRAVLLNDELRHFDRSEAHVRRGKALLAKGDWSDAEVSFRTVLDTNNSANININDRLSSDHRFIVLAHFGVGQANHGRMNEIPLILPPDKMRVDLEQKADYLLAAQGAYIRALREHHPHWSVAAGYKIGRLYQDFYLDIFAAEVPDDLTEAELAYYFEELRNKIEVLVDRALHVYERNLSFSRRVAVGPDAQDWIAATALHLERMQAFLEDPLVQAHAERLVLEEGDLSNLWDPAYYARAHVRDALSVASSDRAAPQAPATDDVDDPDTDEADPDADDPDGVARR